MKIWIVSMECAGIVEAGGVKDVTYALCENFSKEKHDVTLFIPVFASNSFDTLKNIQADAFCTDIFLCGQTQRVRCTSAEFALFPAKVMLVNHPAFSEKKDVYVYTAEEQRLNPAHVRGTGHTDMHFLDALLSKAVASYAASVPQTEQPDIIHCQDASTAVTPCYIAASQPELMKKTACFVTIHNAGPAYHHEFASVDEARYYTGLSWEVLSEAQNGGRVEPFLLAAKNAVLTAVSTCYAEELLDPAFNDETDGLSGIFSARKIPVFGITNGIDYNHYSPEHTEISGLPFPVKTNSGSFVGKEQNREFFLNLCRPVCSTDETAACYTENLCRFGFLSEEQTSEPHVYFVYHGRIVRQKGILLLLEAMASIMKENDAVRLIIMGQGEPALENSVQEFVSSFEGKAVYFKGYNRRMPRLCIVSADFSVLPSFFEPCCLEDFISQIFGTVPVAHATGGLKKIIDGETGFLYSPNTFDSLKAAIEKAVDFRVNHFDDMKKMMRHAVHYVKKAYSWETVIRNGYLQLFEKNEKSSENGIDTFC